MASPGLRKRGLRKPQHRRGVPAGEEVVTDEATGISYEATGSAPGEPKPRGPKFTWKAWREHTVQSFMQAISLAAFVVASLVVLWFLSQTRLLQMTARETHLLHGTIALVKNNPTESAGVPYITNPFLWHWLMDNPQNREVLVEEGGVVPMLRLVAEDNNQMLTRMTLAVLHEVVEAPDALDARTTVLVARTLADHLAKHAGRAFHRRSEETAASALARLMATSTHAADAAKHGVLDRLAVVRGWMKDVGISAEIDAALPLAEKPPVAQAT
eukprot:jgi/Tetstr1/453150/TSEL_040170.t1